MDKDLENFIDTLNELLESLDISFTAFAEKIKTDPHAINNWLAGKFYPNSESLIALSDYFECSIDFLFQFADRKEYHISKNHSTFIERFKHLVETSNPKLTEYKVAKLCGIQQSTISKWYHQNRIPETTTLIKLKKIFDCSLDYLLGRADNNTFY